MAPTEPTRELDENIDTTVPGSSAAAARTQRVAGDRIARYEIEAQLGAGGMGVVYAAHDTALGRRVALKLLHPGRGGDHGARLLREGQALARLSHPNVVTVFDVGAAGDDVYMAMELIQGSTLAAWHRTTNPVPSKTLEMLRAAGRGLAAAHAAGIIHRDFKPENVLVGDDGSVRVTDFGLARPVGEDLRRDAGAEVMAGAMTETGAVVGTPAYMAPEQLDGGAVTPAADQFAFSVTAFELLHGKRPFAGDTLAALRSAIASQTIAEGEAVAVPARVVAAIRRGLRVDPAERFASMNELLAELAPPRSRRRTIVFGAVGGVVAIAATIGVVLISRSTTPPDHCSIVAEEPSTVWNPRVATVLRAGFAATGRPEATRAADMATERLDAWTRRLSEERLETCQDARAAKISVGEADRRERCLERQVDALRARVEVMVTKPSGEVVDRAVELAAPSLEDCSIAKAEPPAPESPGARETIARLEREVARVEAVYTSGRTDITADAETLVTDAHTLGWSPLIARAEIVAGSCYQATDLTRAKNHFTRAIEAATTAADDRLQAEAWLGLLRVQNSFDDLDGLATSVLAVRTAVARVETPQLATWSAYEIGEALMALGRTDEALAACAEANKRADDLPADDAERHGALRCTAEIHYKLRHTQEALVAQQAVVAFAEKVWGPDHPNTAIDIASLANLLERTGKTDEGIALRQRQIAIYERTFGRDGDLTILARFGLATAMSHNFSIHTPEVIGLAEQAIADAERIGGARFTLELPRMHSDMAGLLRQTDLPGAIRHVEQAIRGFEVQGPGAHFKLGAAHNNLGDLLVQSERYDEAAVEFAKTAEIWRGIPGIATWTIGIPLSGSGMALLQANRPGDAVAPLEEAVKYFENPDAQGRYRGQAHWFLAGALWDSGGDRRRARALLEQAITELSALGPSGAPQLAQAKEMLAEWNRR